MPVEFRILEPLEVLRDGVVVPCGGAKQRAVLADLLIHANQVVSVDRLVDDLWGENPPDTAANALQVYISGLRKVVGGASGQILVTRKPGYVLLVGPDALDLFQFEALAARGRAVMASDPSAAVATFTEGLALWRGPPLGDLAFESFAAAEVMRLEEMRAAVVEDLVEAKLAIGQYEAVIGPLHRLIADHPLRERPRRQLMLALYRSGRQAEALASYRLFRDQLDEELGIEPSPALRDLESAILNQDSRLAQPVPPPGGETIAPLVVSPETSHPTDLSPAHLGRPRVRERKVVTVVWCGLVFGAFETNADIEDQWARTEEYHRLIRQLIEEYGGTIELMAGDTIMAAFGAPVAHEDDPRRAVLASLRICEAVEARSVGREATVARVRVGVATGEALVTISPESTGRGRVAGDVVGLASRVYESAPVGTIRVSEGTFRAAERSFDCEEIAPLAVEEGAEAVGLWRVRGRRESSGVRPGPSASPSVGRKLEQELLASCLARSTRASEAHLVTIVGEPGVGKSRLVADLLAHVEASLGSVTWRQGRCLPYGDGVGFWALGEIVKAHCGILETETPEVAVAKLDRVVPDDHPDASWLRQRVRPLVGVEAPRAGREENFAAWRAFMELIADDGPAVLVFEDLHWADDSLLAFVEDLVEFAVGVPMLVVAAARPELYDHVPGWAASVRNATRIYLSPLSAQDMNELIGQLLGTREFPEEVRTAVLSRAGGNPLYAGEFLRLLQDRKLLTNTGSSWLLAHAAEIAVPGTVHDTIAARLDTLPVERKRLLQDAAVIGEVFWPSGVAAIGDRERNDVDRLLHALSRVGLVKRTRHSSMPNQAEYAFHHALVRDVCYAQMPLEERAGRHARTADWIEGVAPAAGLIGHHLAEAFKYCVELRQLDSHARGLALRSAHFLVADCQRALRYGDRATAERQTGRIVDLLAECGPEVAGSNLPLMEQTAKLLVTMGHWHDAVALLTPFASTGHGPLIRDLGVALCQIHRSEPRSGGYRRGQRLLELASATPNPDTDALASLAGTWKGVDDARAQVLYHQCLDIDPADPYSLGNVLEYEIAAAGDWSMAEHMRGQIDAANHRCRTQANAGENLPWAYFDAGKFSLLLGLTYDSLTAFAKAVHLTTADHMLVTSMASLARLASPSRRVPSLTSAQSLLAIARKALFPSDASDEGLLHATPLAGVDQDSSVVVLAGGADPNADSWVAGHADLVLEAFRDFAGTVVSGGTTSGVPGLAGSLRVRYPNRINTVGYLTAEVPAGVTLDTRYDEVRRSPGREFSIAESLQAWADLIVSGVAPTTVKVLAVNGGPIAGTEYRIALALGCLVGVVVGSGREADRLLADPDWSRVRNLIRLEADAEAIKRFLESRP